MKIVIGRDRVGRILEQGKEQQLRAGNQEGLNCLKKNKPILEGKVHEMFTLGSSKFNELSPSTF